MSILAHTSSTGWDEVLLALSPLALSAVLFSALRYRTAHKQEA